MCSKSDAFLTGYYSSSSKEPGKLYTTMIVWEWKVFSRGYNKRLDVVASDGWVYGLLNDPQDLLTCKLQVDK